MFYMGVQDFFSMLSLSFISTFQYFFSSKSKTKRFLGEKKTKREMRLRSMGYRVLKKVKFYFLCKKEKRKKKKKRVKS